MAANMIDCPVCGKTFTKFVINTHVNQCINSLDEELDEVKSPMKQPGQEDDLSRPNKRRKSDKSDVTPFSPALPEPTRTATTSASNSPVHQDPSSWTRTSSSSSTSSAPASAAWAAFGFNMNASSNSKSPANKSGKLSSSKTGRAQSVLDPQESPGTSAGSGSGGTPLKNGKARTSRTGSNNTAKSNKRLHSGQLKVVKPAPSTSSSATPNKKPNLSVNNGMTEFQELFGPTQVNNANEHENGKTGEISVKKNLFGSKTTAQDQCTKGSDLAYRKPLAERMRPTSISDYVGQKQILGRNKLLRTLVEAHQIPSMILWGPPGCGKTTLARIIANRCKESHNTRFVSLSATTSGVNDVKEVVKVARNEKKLSRRSTILFIDEIHRFNKLQQDAFLPHVEEGIIILIGATTENPSFQVNNALMSRCRVIQLEKLSVENVKEILVRSLECLGAKVMGASLTGDETGILIEDAALTSLAQLCGGDARTALNSLQLAVSSKAVTQNDESDLSLVTVEDVKEGLLKSQIQYDRAGEDHYNCASALQKSIRGSDENAAIYWFSRMIEGGEDPRFIARRLVVTASEDIGLADPQALPLAVSAMQTCQLIGMPECAINLAHCVAYLAKAPKSNVSYMAMKKARQLILDCAGPQPGVPLHLRNAPTTMMKNMGYGQGGAARDQTYLPETLRGVKFFPPSSR